MLFSNHSGNQFISRSETSTLGTLLPNHKYYSWSKNYKYFKMKSCPMGSFRGFLCLFVCLIFLTERSQDMDRNLLISCNSLFSTVGKQCSTPQWAWALEKYKSHNFHHLLAMCLCMHLTSLTVNSLTFKRISYPTYKTKKDNVCKASIRMKRVQ